MVRNEVSELFFAEYEGCPFLRKYSRLKSMVFDLVGCKLVKVDNYQSFCLFLIVYSNLKIVCRKIKKAPLPDLNLTTTP